MRGSKMIAALMLATAVALPAAAGDVRVDGYYRQDGTYVQPHHRSAPDRNPYNNYSSQGNVNPYTGRSGTVAPSYRSGGSTGSGVGTPPLGNPGGVYGEQPRRW